MQVVNVGVCIPFSGRYVPPEWAIGLTCLTVPMNCTTGHFYVKGHQRDEARNILVDSALKLNCKHILFIDDDTAPPADAIHKLLYTLDNADEDVMACGGVYVTKSDPPIPVVLQDEGGGAFWRWKKGEIFEVQAVGTGCMMIKTEIFKHIEKPYFKDIKTLEEARQFGVVDPDADNNLRHFEMTDDVFFCKKVQKAGFKVLAHGGVLPVHWDDKGKSYELPPDCYPLRVSATTGLYDPKNVNKTLVLRDEGAEFIDIPSSI